MDFILELVCSGILFAIGWVLERGVRAARKKEHGSIIILIIVFVPILGMFLGHTWLSGDVDSPYIITDAISFGIVFFGPLAIILAAILYALLPLRQTTIEAEGIHSPLTTNEFEK